MIDKGECDKGFIWNPSSCECERDKLCDIGEYLDYENCKCRKKLVDKLVEECTENVDEAKITEITENKCKSSCTIYVVIIAIVFTICIEIGTYFVYFKYMNHWYLKMLLVLILVPVLKQQFNELINGTSQRNKH